MITVPATIFCAPLLAGIAIWVKIDSPGPVFFRQKRVGIHQKYFEILKFRTMRADTPKDVPTHLLENPDQYITKSGKFLRATSLDELPQIFNILKGDMSLVGPRPERPEIAALYSERIPEFDYRLKVKAGLTGYAQVYGKYNTTPYDKLKLDLTYIETYSLKLDLKLLMLTFKILFQKENTEGVEAWQKTAGQEKNEEND